LRQLSFAFLTSPTLAPMPLQLPPGTRFKRLSEEDALPLKAISEFEEFIYQIVAQGDRQDLFEHFKGHFCNAMGVTHWVSSNVSWAQSDLETQMRNAAQNAPLFVGAFYDACDSLANEEGTQFDLPSVEQMNQILQSNGVLLEIQPPKLVRLGASIRVPIPEPPPTFEESAADVIRKSLQRSQDLINENRPLDAVLHSLWILESLVTAFRGAQLPSGTIEGKYFNEIAKELSAGANGPTLKRVIDWATGLHGYLSSPTGGGVRHGLDLKSGTPISMDEGRLFCNLILSFITFLMSEHARIHTTY
jgi:hypothetical protein